LGPPPPERPNWHSLNSSQKRYALFQHNLARQRRNLPIYVLGDPPEENSASTSNVSVHSNQEEDDVIRIPNDWNYETDSDLDWHFDEGKNPNISNVIPMNVSSSSVGKRENDSSPSGSSTPKKAKLPGTGHETAADPDTGNPSIENSVIPRPFHNSTGYKLVFRKNHSLTSYGVASVQLQLGSYASERMGTTSLMYLPVDKPYFYISPVNFGVLPCKKY